MSYPEPNATQYAEKKIGKAIGAVELILNGHTDMTCRDDECELGYWLGKAFLGQRIHAGGGGRTHPTRF